jgi:hypothetical protein
MLDVFQTKDDAIHQAALFFDGQEIVSLVVERLIPQADEPAGWDWMVWKTHGSWTEPVTGWHGSEPSLELAKLAALDAAIVLVDQATQYHSFNATAGRTFQ